MKRIIVVLMLLGAASCKFACAPEMTQACERACGALGVKQINMEKDPYCECYSFPERAAKEIK